MSSPTRLPAHRAVRQLAIGTLLSLAALWAGGVTVSAQESKPRGTPAGDEKKGDEKKAGEKTDKPRFIDRGDYVEDSKTGLLWQKDGTASGKLNFYDAAKCAKSLKLGDVTGWRVPKPKELAEIFPAVDKPFTNTKYNKEACCAGPGEYNSYWTSELDTRLDDYAFVYQWYAKGGANNCFASKNFVYVRCVHDPVTPAAPPVPIDEATAKRAKELIGQLGDERFEVRAKATAALKEMGTKIEPLLREALKNATDAEVRVRLESLLRKPGDD
jgi:hypothetical protein